ncbi:hypothetical protein RB595_004134 [Gaeumannomyces hyphopodioides]
MSSPPATAITLRAPSKYASSSSSSPTPPPDGSGPSTEFLHRTWSVTHSTLSMWRAARNVRITYKPLPPSSSARMDDLVEYENRGGKGGVKSVAGVDTAAGDGNNTSWDWRGSGLLFFVTSHWEVLGWGERPLASSGEGGEGAERWAVTWFAPTLFTAEGLDIYCDRAEGLSAETAALVLAALKDMGVERLTAMVEKDMQPVEISLPWKTK